MKPDKPSAVILPDNILKRITPEQRKAFGKAGRTSDEVAAAAEITVEKELHKLISQELRRREIPFIHAAMNKKSPLPPGFPDFTIFAAHGAVLLVEVKVGKNTLQKDQMKCVDSLAKQGHPVILIRAFEAFKNLLLANASSSQPA